MKLVIYKRIFNLLMISAASAAAVCAQDLGSSNKLFGGSRKAASSARSTKAPPVKRSAPKPRASAKRRPAENPTIKAKPKETAAASRKPAETKASTRPPKENTSAAKSLPANTTSAKTTLPEPKRTPEDTSRFKQFGGEAKAEAKAPTVKTLSAAESRLLDIQFEDLIAAGNEARDDRNYAAAETAYKKAASVKPRDPRAAYGLGNVYSDQRRWEEAEKAYRNSLQIDPSSAVAYIALSYVLTQPLFVPNLSDRYEEAESIARKAIQYAPSNALAHDQLGVAMELRGLIGPETEGHYRRAIQLDPGFAPAYAHLARLLRRRGANSEASAAYENALKRADDVPTMVLVAEVMQSELRFKESEKLLKKALSEDPRNSAALLLMGRAQTALGKTEDAERTLRSSLMASPDSFQANSLLGDLYIRQDKLEMAENALLQSSRWVTSVEKRRLAMQFETLGDRFVRAGRREAAQRSYQQALSLDAERDSIADKLTKTRRG